MLDSWMLSGADCALNVKIFQQILWNRLLSKIFPNGNPFILKRVDKIQRPVNKLIKYKNQDA